MMTETQKLNGDKRFILEQMSKGVVLYRSRSGGDWELDISNGHVNGHDAHVLALRGLIQTGTSPLTDYELYELTDTGRLILAGHS